MNCSQLLGFLGTGLVIIAYVPQVRHVIKEHCSRGDQCEGLQALVYRLGPVLDARHHYRRPRFCDGAECHCACRGRRPGLT